MVASKQAALSSMIVTIDATILFNSLLALNSRIAKILSDPHLMIQRVSCHYAVVELFKHQPKIVKLAKKPLKTVIDDLSTLINGLQLFNEMLIESHY